MDKRNRTVESARLAVLENHDLLREIGNYIDLLFPFILSFKSVYDALKPKEYEENTCWIYSNLSNFAISVAMIEWIQTMKYDINELFPLNSLYPKIAYHGSVEVMKWALWTYPSSTLPFSVPIQYEDHICSSAADNGKLEMLKFLRSLDPPCGWSHRTVTSAAIGGHLKVLEWLLTQEPPCPWGLISTEILATKGYLHMLTFLKNRKMLEPCFLSTSACDNAASEGH